MTTPQQYGYDFRSNPEVYQANGTITIRADYMMGARDWIAPEVRGLLVMFTGSIAAAGDHVGSAALGRDFAKLFSNFKFRVQNQDLIQISGAALRVLMIGELGGRVTDPTDVALNVPATVTNFLYIPFACPRNVRERDTSIALSDFLESGELTISTAAAPPTGWGPVGADWKIRVFADVQEGRTRELKSLRRISEVNVTNQELTYDVGGALRWAFLTTSLTTTGYSTLAAITNVNSVTMQWPAAYETSVLRHRYQRNQIAPTTLDEFLLAAPGAIPLVFPWLGQKTGRLPDLRSFHLDLLVAPTAGLKLVLDRIVQRHPDAVAKTLGYDSATQALAALQSHGVIVGAADNYPASTVPAGLRQHLPARVKPAGVTRS